MGAVCGEGGAEREASCWEWKAWNSLHRAVISTQSSAMILEGLRGKAEAVGWGRA